MFYINTVQNTLALYMYHDNAVIKRTFCGQYQNTQYYHVLANVTWWLYESISTVDTITEP